jgi:hypothetical protein
VILPPNHSLEKSPIYINTTETLDYNQFSSVSRFLTPGTVTLDQIKAAQESDDFTRKLKEKRDSRFKMIDGILFRLNTTTNQNKLILLDAFLQPAVNTRHFSSHSMYSSRSRIRRDLTKNYFINIQKLNKILDEIVNNCIHCQFNSNTPQGRTYKKSDFAKAPRTAWAIDLIPSLPQMESGYTAILLAVNLFTGFIQLTPIKSRSTEHLQQAILETIIRPFGAPSILRSDQEGGLAKSQAFSSYMEELGVRVIPTSTAAPWSNGHAESSVKTIKECLRKWFQQEWHKDWSTNLHLLTHSHNRSASVYGFSPEELSFGFKNPTSTDLVQLWPDADTPE